MRLSTDSIFPLGILAMLAAMTFWLERVVQTQPEGTAGHSRHDPDFIAEQLDFRQLDPDGALRQSMSASRMLHFPDDDTTELTRPEITYHGSVPSTHIAAERAHVSADRKLVVLSDGVVATRAATRKTDALRVETSELTVFPNDERAATDRPVRISQGRSVITGVGLDFDNAKGISVIRSHVRATLDRKASKK